MQASDRGPRVTRFQVPGCGLVSRAPFRRLFFAAEGAVCLAWPRSLFAPVDDLVRPSLPFDPTWPELPVKGPRSAGC